MTNLRTSILSAAVTAAACASLLGAGTAAADPFVPGGRDARTPEVPSLAYGPACAGRVVGFAHAAAERPGTVQFSAAGGFFGISGTAKPCEVRATIHWHNLTTGAHGAVSGPASGLLPGFGENQSGFSKEARTGHGVVQFTLTTDRPYLAQRAVTIRAY